MDQPFTLETDDGTTTARVDPRQGGRLASLRIDGHELIVQNTGDPVTWGCYPMVPFAGRLRDGRLLFDGQQYELPTNDGRHAMHGFGFTRPWERVGENEIRVHLDEPWPFAAVVTQRFELVDRRLTLAMTFTATERQPVSMGWHPWFRRDIGVGELAELQFSPTSMYQRDVDGLPSGALVEPPPGPWDDCFTGVRPPLVLRWGETAITLSSDVDHWVVYDELSEALCVEPQNGPPNMSNDRPLILAAGEEHSIRFTLDW